VLRLSNKAGGGQGGGIPCSILVSVISVFSDFCSGRSGGSVPVVPGFSTCQFLPEILHGSLQTGLHSRTHSLSYARSTERDEGFWPNPYQTGIWLAIVLIPDIVLLPCFYGIRLWIWPEPLVALGRTRVRRALGMRMSGPGSIPSSVPGPHGWHCVAGGDEPPNDYFNFVLYTYIQY
jgi:hypothetical protein